MNENRRLNIKFSFTLNQLKNHLIHVLDGAIAVLVFFLFLYLLDKHTLVVLLIPGLFSLWLIGYTVGSFLERKFLEQNATFEARLVMNVLNNNYTKTLLGVSDIARLAELNVDSATFGIEWLEEHKYVTRKDDDTNDVAFYVLTFKGKMMDPKGMNNGTR